MQDVVGKVAFITGGASGMGLAMARSFSAAGMKVVIADVDFLTDSLAFGRSFFGMTALGDNSALLVNAIEELSGSRIH